MTIGVMFLNDANGQPAVYTDRTDLDRFTLTLTSDSPTPVAVSSVRVRFPVKIFALATIKTITVTSPGWNPAAVAGPYLTLTPVGAVTLSSTAPVVLQLAGVKTTNPAATTDEIQVNVAGEAPATKIFSMQFPSEAGDLSKAIDVGVSPSLVYRTPARHDRIENVVILRLTNTNPNQALVTKDWVRRPTIQVSFVYGNDIGALTPADSMTVDPHSAFRIAIDVQATYKDGQRLFEWAVTPPDPAVTDTPPVWILRPVPENRSVLGKGAGANAEFRISDVSTDAPVGSTLIYLQYSDFPGYSDGFVTKSFAKAEPEPSVIYFDGTPAWVAEPGKPVTVEWQTFGVDRVRLLANGTAMQSVFNPAHDSFTLNIERETKFALEAYFNSGDSVPARTPQWTGNVPEATILDFSADVQTTADGSPVTLTWSTRAALSATLLSSSGPSLEIPKADLIEGSKEYYPRRLTTFTLQVVGQGNPPARAVRVFVLTRGWSSRSMGFNPKAGQGPVLYGTDAGLVLVSGQSDNAIFVSADGETWTEAGVAAFPARNDAAGCVLAGKLWIMGGLAAGHPRNDVWRSDDGMTWVQSSAAAPWPPRSRFACVAFRDKLWIFGGQDQNLSVLGDIWTSGDGTSWSRVTVTGPSWPARSGLAVTQHAGKLWLFGGRLADDSLTDDLWCSEDGASWTSLDAGHTGAREFATLGSTGASLYVFGGNDAGGASLNDLSVYDGGSWDLDTGPSRWTISRPGFAVWRDAFWFAGGLDGSANSASVWSWYPGPPE